MHALWTTGSTVGGVVGASEENRIHQASWVLCYIAGLQLIILIYLFEAGFQSITSSYSSVALPTKLKGYLAMVT